MVELFQLILGVLASLFKSRARLEAECMNSLSSRRGSESGEAPIEELIRVSHPRVGYACQVCLVWLPRSESRRSALPLPKLPEDLRFSKASVAGKTFT